jgi:hypothetical protein
MANDIENNLLTDLISKRLDKLTLNFEKTLDYKMTFARLEMCYNNLRQCLHECDLKVISDIDDCFVEVLIIFEKYFYIKGYKDGRRSKGIFKRLFAGLKKLLKDITLPCLNIINLQIRGAKKC